MFGLFGEELGGLVEVHAEDAAFDDHAEDVFEGQVGLLDVHGGAGGDDEVMVAVGGHFASSVAREAYCENTLFFALGEGVEDIGGVARGGDAEEDVAGLGEGFNLTGEDLVEAEVVAAGGEDGGVYRQRYGTQRGAVDGEAYDEFGDEVLSVGGGASVAGYEELAAVAHGFGDLVADDYEGFGDGCVVEDGLHGGDGLRELTADEVDHGFGTPLVQTKRQLQRQAGSVFRVGQFFSRDGYRARSSVREGMRVCRS